MASKNARMPLPIFHREELALRIAQQVLASGIGAASSSGLFLAAPRRTGKSTFIREDLRPALALSGAVVLYIDLWANKAADPGDLIARAVAEELARYKGVIKRLAKSVGIDKVGVPGFVSLTFEKDGVKQAVSLTDALAALSDEVEAPIVLLIDEAQHAITTEAGYSALFALKAARDELNSSLHFGLRMVATGSNRDKLATLRNGKDQAFFGAPLVAFPTLGKDYVEWFCAGVDLPQPLDPEKVFKLFKQAGSRPELLAAALDEVRFNFELDPSEVEKAVVAAVKSQIALADAQTMQVINSLTPLQSVVLRVLAIKADRYAPFDDSTIKLYKLALKVIAPTEKLTPDVSNVQQALAALQDKGLVWREKRGVYALEENAIADLLRTKGLLELFSEIDP